MADTYMPTKPVEMFNDLVPAELQSKIAKAVVSQYSEAYKYCYERFLPTEAHDLLPHHRRACIESVIPDLAEGIESCVAESRKNKAKNCSHRLIVNNRIILTQSKVEQSEILPRNAEFRSGYAESPQMFFSFMNEDKTPESDEKAPLYAIIIHMPMENSKNSPEFVNIVFPDKFYEVIVQSIRLLDKFPDIRPEIKEENIPGDLEIKLWRSIKRRVNRSV